MQIFYNPVIRYGHVHGPHCKHSYEHKQAPVKKVPLEKQTKSAWFSLMGWLRAFWETMTADFKWFLGSMKRRNTSVL